MKNTPVGEFEAEDLEGFVARVLLDVGNPEPPLDLRIVRDRLGLDLEFFSVKDPNLLQRARHKAKVGLKQVRERPALLIEAFKKADISGLFVPDEKRILIHSAVPKLKHRWVEAHEIGHSLIPWHERFMYEDTGETLQPWYQEQIEREANFVAGQLTFLQGRFSAEAQDSVASLKFVRSLAKKFGNTITSTMWRFVEEAHKDLPVLGLVQRKSEPKPGVPSDYCIESPAFREQFGWLGEDTLLQVPAQYRSRYRQLGDVGTGEVTLTDCNGQLHLFFFESWASQYYTLSLGQYVRPVVSTIIVPTIK